MAEDSGTRAVRIVLPAHLKALARISGEVRVEVRGAITQRSVLDALEAEFPMLLGTIRDRTSARRRPFVRFYACEEDLSANDPDIPLPGRVASGEEPFLVVGAMAGG